MGAQAASSGDEQSTHAAAAPRVRWFGLTGLIGVGCIAFGVQQVSDDLPHLLLTSRGECRFPALAWCRSEAHTHRTQRDARCEVTPPPPVPPLLTMTPSDTLDHVRKHGYARVPEVLPRELVARLHAELLRHLKADSSYYSPKGCLGKLNSCSLRWDLPLLFDAVPSLAEGKSKKGNIKKKHLKTVRRSAISRRRQVSHSPIVPTCHTPIVPSITLPPTRRFDKQQRARSVNRSRTYSTS